MQYVFYILCDVCGWVHDSPQISKTTLFFPLYVAFILWPHRSLLPWSGILLPAWSSKALSFFNFHLKWHILYLYYNVWLPPESNSRSWGIYNLDLKKVSSVLKGSVYIKTDLRYLLLTKATPGMYREPLALAYKRQHSNHQIDNSF